MYTGLAMEGNNKLPISIEVGEDWKQKLDSAANIYQQIFYNHDSRNSSKKSSHVNSLVILSEAPIETSGLSTGTCQRDLDNFSSLSDHYL